MEGEQLRCPGKRKRELGQYMTLRRLRIMSSLLRWMKLSLWSPTQFHISSQAGEMVVILDDADPNWWKGSNHRGEVWGIPFSWHCTTVTLNLLLTYDHNTSGHLVIPDTCLHLTSQNSLQQGLFPSNFVTTDLDADARGERKRSVVFNEEVKLWFDCFLPD